MSGKTILSGIAVIAVNLNALACANVSSAPRIKESVDSAAVVKNKQDYPIRKETRQTFQLSPNALVEVSEIEGAVEVETTNNGTAEMIFIREARTQVDFDCESIDAQQSSGNLVIRHYTKKEPQCRIIQAREHLKLKLPKSANLNFQNIEGGFSIGETEGFVQLKNIEGSVQIARAKAAEISSVENNVSLNVSEINSPGIKINNIEGRVELGVRKDLNASLRIKASNIQVDIPNSQSAEMSRRTYQLQLGAGGENISISNIEGSVRVRGL